MYGDLHPSQGVPILPADIAASLMARSFPSLVYHHTGQKQHSPGHFPQAAHEPLYRDGFTRLSNSSAPSNKRGWSAAFPANSDMSNVSSGSDLHAGLANASAHASATGNATSLQILSQMLSASSQLHPDALKSCLGYQLPAPFPTNITPPFPHIEPISNYAPPSYHPADFEHPLTTLSHLLNPLLALVKHCTASTAAAHYPDASHILSAQHHADLLALSLRLKAATDAAEEAQEPSSSPPQPSSPKGFQEYHKVVSSMPPALQARLRKKIRIIQPISKTWQADALQPPSNETTMKPAPPPPPSAPPTAGFREYRKQASNGSTSTLRTEGTRGSQGDSSSRSTTSSPNQMTTTHTLSQPSLTSSLPSQATASTRAATSLPPKTASTSHPDNKANPDGMAHARIHTALAAEPSNPASHLLAALIQQGIPPSAVPPHAIALPSLHAIPNTLVAPFSLSKSQAELPQSNSQPSNTKSWDSTRHPYPHLNQSSQSASVAPLPAPLNPDLLPANSAVLSTVQGQLGVLYQWYVHSKGAYLEEAKRLLTVIDQQETQKETAPAHGVDTKAVLRAFDKAIQIMRASQTCEKQWMPTAPCSQQVGHTDSGTRPTNSEEHPPAGSPMEANC